MAIIDVVRQVDRFVHLEIRCDERNAPSAAVPKRLGFRLSETIDQPPTKAEQHSVQLQIWTSIVR